MTTAAASKPRKQSSRSYWTKTLHQWHWISSAICLVGLLLFTVTGITLNHASSIEGQPKVTTGTAVLPERLLPMIKNGEGDQPLPVAVRDWVAGESRQDLKKGTVEWSEGEVAVSMPRAGGDAWLVIDRTTGDIEWENTSRGVVSYFNDLHKGRNTGTVWKWFIDIFAVACLVFTLTGLVLLYLHGRHRRMTWPLVGAGLVIPALLLLLFLH